MDTWNDMLEVREESAAVHAAVLEIRRKLVAVSSILDTIENDSDALGSLRRERAELISELDVTLQQLGSSAAQCDKYAKVSAAAERCIDELDTTIVRLEQEELDAIGKTRWDEA